MIGRYSDAYHAAYSKERNVIAQRIQSADLYAVDDARIIKIILHT